MYWDITRAVKRRFDEEGVSIPFPQRDVHVYHEDVDSGQQPRAISAPASGHSETEKSKHSKPEQVTEDRVLDHANDNDGDNE